MGDKALILIPARYGSTRFPGKPLAKIKNKSMIQRVYENMNGHGVDVCIVTDDDRIEEHVKEFGGVVQRVDDNVPSGTERIKLCYERFYKSGYDLIINVQGDEPLLNFSTISNLINFHKNNEFQLTTILTKRDKSDERWGDPNVVKAVYSPGSHECHYFSRASVPYDRDSTSNYWYQHIGVYCFSPLVLQAFPSWPQSLLEKLECLEQLRAIDNGVQIGALVEQVNLIGVDSEKDLKKVEGLVHE